MRAAGAFALAGQLRRVWRGGAAGGPGAVRAVGGGSFVWDVPNGKETDRVAQCGRAGGDARAGRSAAEALGKRSALERPVQGELRGLLNRYLTHLLGHGLEMHRYLTAQEAKTRQVPTR